MRIFTSAVLFFVFSFCSCGMFAGETQPYEVNAVINPVYGINDSARFTGSAPLLGGIQAYFGSTTSLPSNLGKFGGANATGAAISADDAGDAVVAVSIDGTKGAVYRKVNRVYTTTSLPASVPTGVNKDGWACGWKSVNGNLHAFASNPGGTIKDLTPNATYGYAYAMNNSGWIVGEIDGAAFRWDPSTFAGNPADGISLIQHNDFGLVDQSYAASINNDGQILVVVKHNNVNRTFIWDAGTVTECLAPEDMSATGAFINNSGDVIGYADTTPVYWWNDGLDMQEFSTMTQTALTVTHFYGFNNSGDIVASGSDGNGNTWFYLEREPDGSDTVPPLVTNLSVGPMQNGYVTSTTPTVTATVTDGGFGVNWTCLYFMIDDIDIDWSRDGADIIGIPFEAISEGPHTATINVRDHVGNITVTDCIFTVDTVAPEIDNLELNGRTSANPSTDSPYPQFSYSLSDSNSGVDANSLCIAIDAGNIVSAGTGLYGNLVWDYAEDGHFTIHFDDDGDEHLIGYLFPGTHIITVSITDIAGNLATEFLEFEVTGDVTPPQVVDILPVDGGFAGGYMTDISARFVDFDAGGQQQGSGVDASRSTVTIVNSMQIEALSISFSASGFTLPVSELENDTYTITVTLSDLRPGNVADPVVWTVIVDKTAPEISGREPAHSDYVTSLAPGIEVTFTDPGGSGVDIYRSSVTLDGVEIDFSASGFSLDGLGLDNAAHSFVICLVDNAGNIADPVIWDIIVDHDGPNVVSFSPPEGTCTAAASIEITAVFEDPGLNGIDLLNSTVTLDGVGIPFDEFGVSYDALSLEEGSHEVQIQLVDLLGNLGKPLLASFLVDFTAPEITIISPEDGYLGRPGYYTILAEYVENGSGIDQNSLRIVSSLGVSAPAYVISDGYIGGIIELPAGVHEIHIEAMDKAGNVAGEYPIGISLTGDWWNRITCCGAMQECAVQIEDCLYFIPEMNDELSIRRKGGQNPLSPDNNPGTNVQDIECWTSNDRGVAYYVKESSTEKFGLAISTNNLQIKTNDRFWSGDPMEIYGVNVARCGDYPCNFWGHRPPQRRREYFSWPAVQNQEGATNTTCLDYRGTGDPLKDVVDLQIAKDGEKQVCSEGNSGVAQVKTGIMYGYAEVSAGSSTAAKIKLVRLDADGLKDSSKTNLNLDTESYPIGRTPFADFVPQSTAPDLYICPSTAHGVKAIDQFNFSADGGLIRDPLAYEFVEPLNYLWEFGDGATFEELFSFHTYPAAGIYTVTFTVTDSSEPPKTWTTTFPRIVVRKQAGEPFPRKPIEVGGEQGVPVRIFALGPAGQAINVTVEGTGNAAVSLDGSFTGCGAAMPFQMILDGRGQATEYVYLQSIENGVGAGGVIVRGEELSWTTSASGLESQHGFIQTDSESTTVIKCTVVLDRIDQDDPANTTWTPVNNEIFGGSIPSTADDLRITIPDAPPGTSFSWSITGNAASHYTPSGNSNIWIVGDLKPIYGLLTFNCELTFPGGPKATVSKTIDVGVRTDDAIMIAWIDPLLVPLSTTGVQDVLLEVFRPNGTVCSWHQASSLLAKTALLRGKLALPQGIAPNMADRRYLINWQFKYGSNPNPSSQIPGVHFITGGIIDYNKIKAYVSVDTRYKLFNHFQIKYFAKNGAFVGTPTVLSRPGLSNTYIGQTEVPIAQLPFPGQKGPMDGMIVFDKPAPAATLMSQINEGSPDAGAITGFNVVVNQNPPMKKSPVFWESIGSRIGFQPSGGALPLVWRQVYPTYYYYVNGILVNTTMVQAADPLDTFFGASYPFGTAPTTFGFGLFNSYPGGRNGDATANPDAKVRTPPPSFIQKGN